MSPESHDGAHEGCAQDAAPYVLGALTEPEYEAFKVHLESCAICREEVAALQVVAASLPAAVPQLTASPDLKSRVMATVEAEAKLRNPRPSRRATRNRPLARFSPRPMLGSLAATAAAVIVAVLILSPSGTSPTHVIRAQVTFHQASATLRIGSGHAELKIIGMPQTLPGHVYEVWLKRSGQPQPTNALFTVSKAGDATVGVPGVTGSVKTVMVTAEPEGGSRVPTTAPVIVANIS
jgi:anti-sigma-K factor RskA